MEFKITVRVTITITIRIRILIIHVDTDIKSVLSIKAMYTIKLKKEKHSRLRNTDIHSLLSPLWLL